MPARDPEDVDRQEIQQFLDSKGGVELLIILSEEELRHDELEAEMSVASSTFHLRREQAGELNLITTESRNANGDVQDFYKLTGRGEAIARQARQQGLAKLFWRLQELRDQYEESRENLLEWVADEDSNFVDRLISIQRHEEEGEHPFDRDFYR